MLFCGGKRLRYICRKYCKIGRNILTMKAEEPIKHQKQDILLYRKERFDKNRASAKFEMQISGISLDLDNTNNLKRMESKHYTKYYYISYVNFHHIFSFYIYNLFISQ